MEPFRDSHVEAAERRIAKMREEAAAAIRDLYSAAGNSEHLRFGSTLRRRDTVLGCTYLAERLLSIEAQLQECEDYLMDDDYKDTDCVEPLRPLARVDKLAVEEGSDGAA